MRLRLQNILYLSCLLVGLGTLGCAALAPILLVMDMAGVDDKANIKYHFEKDAKRVAVVVNLARNHQIDVGHFDRDVNSVLSALIANYTKKKPDIILAAKVHKWLDEHQDWKTPYEIGQGVGADYVVFVEIRHVKFYEKEGWKQYYKGTCDTSVSIHRVGNEQDQAVPVWEMNSYRMKFPTGVEPISESDMPLSRFRDLFVLHTAERLSWLFVPHASSKEYGEEKN